MTPNRDPLLPLLARRVLILDGAMGTMIQRHKLTEEDFRGERFRNHHRDLRGNSDILNLTRPDVIGGIHREYLVAGADIIETNTFTSTAIAQADYALEGLGYELNLHGARLARAAVDEWNAKAPEQSRLVAGSMGPMNRTLSISPKVDDPAFRAMTFDEARAAYEDQVRGLIDGGAHILLLETIFDTLNAKAGIVAIENVFEERGVRLPLFISVTVTDRSGRTLSGQTLDAFYASIRHARPVALGINCARNATTSRRARAARGVLRPLLPKRRPAERVRPVRSASGRDRRALAGIRRRRSREHRWRMLRHDARSHSRDCERRERADAQTIASGIVGRGGGPRTRGGPARAGHDVGRAEPRAASHQRTLLSVLRSRDADDPTR
jgi:methionine synthase I (cobalamin-dependent)